MTPPAGLRIGSEGPGRGITFGHLAESRDTVSA